MACRPPEAPDGGPLPTRAEFAILEWAAHNERHGLYACSGDRYRKRVFLRCVARGWLREVEHLCEKVGDGGFLIEPTQYAVGYALTDTGKTVVAIVAIVNEETQRRSA